MMRNQGKVEMGSAFQQAVHHTYAQADGTYAWPNSREGDMLREAMREIVALRAELTKAQGDPATVRERYIDKHSR
jgi:hypothetical protein